MSMFEPNLLTGRVPIRTRNELAKLSDTVIDRLGEATPEKAGLLSAEDKKNLDGIKNYGYNYFIHFDQNGNPRKSSGYKDEFGESSNIEYIRMSDATTEENVSDDKATSISLEFMQAKDLPVMYFRICNESSFIVNVILGCQIGPYYVTLPRRHAVDIIALRYTKQDKYGVWSGRMCIAGTTKSIDQDPLF